MLFRDDRTLAGKVHLGWFQINPEMTMIGQLDMQHPRRPILTLPNQNQPRWTELPQLPATITGTLPNNLQLTLLNCTQPNNDSGVVEVQSILSQTVTTVPAFVVSGRMHLHPDEHKIAQVKLTLDDTCCLRWDRTFWPLPPGATETTLVPVEWHRNERLFETETALGQISASYYWNMSSIRVIPPYTSQFYLNGEIIISLGFNDFASFEEVQTGLRRILLFLGAVSGYPVEIAQTAIYPEVEDLEEDEQAPRLELLPCPYFPQLYESHQADKFTEPIVRDGESMATLLTQWIDLGEGEQTQRWEARQRFDAGCLRKGRIYDPDRLVAAANLFDLLPDSATQVVHQLSEKSKQAIKSALLAFDMLKDGNDSEKQILHRAKTNLGALKKSSLRDQVRVRAQLVMDQLSPDLDQMYQVTDQAVKLRNWYVHGSTFQLGEPGEFIVFLTQTLEFIFVVSELIEAGWNMAQFTQSQTAHNHFIVVYLEEYQDNIQRIISQSG